MEDNPNRRFDVKTMTLETSPGPGGTVSKAEMHVKTIKGEYLIVLHSPSLIVSSHSDLNELAAKLADVTEVRFFPERSEDGRTIRCKIEILREDYPLESIGCDDTEGLFWLDSPSPL